MGLHYIYSFHKYCVPVRATLFALGTVGPFTARQGPFEGYGTLEVLAATTNAGSIEWREDKLSTRSLWCV